MPAHFTVTLDTTAPGGVTVSLHGGAAFTSARDITAAITSSDDDTTGYQVKIWGDVDESFNASIKSTEGESSWIALASPHAIRLSDGDGIKTINVRVRDTVLNESAPASDTITLDTTVPEVTIISGPDVNRISKQAGADTVTIQWWADADFDQYEVRVVPNSGSPHTAGALIGSTNGSTNTSGGAGVADDPITTAIKGADIEAASPGDGTKTIKVFVRDPNTGEWSL